MNTQENNKLIAEFMGVRHTDDSKYLENLKEMKSDGLYFEQGYMTSELHYYTDWRWLMEVVSKIESLGYWLNKIDGDYWIVNDNGDTIIDNTEHSGGIIAVYNSCVEFIKWYNLNK